MSILKAGRITTAYNGRSHHCNGSAAAPSTAPIRRALRGPRAHRGRREGSAACLDESHPQTSPSPQGRQSARQEKGQRGHTLAGSLPQPRVLQPRPQPPPQAALRPRRSARSQQLQVCLALEQLLVAADKGSKTKGKGISLASFLPAGRNQPQTGATPRRSNASGAPDARPPPGTPLGSGALVSRSPPRAGSLAHYRTNPGRGRDRRERYPLDPEEGTKDGCGRQAGESTGRGKGENCLERFSRIYL